MIYRFMAGQFARPSGWIGRHLIAPWLDRISAEMNRVALDRLELDPTDHVVEIGLGGGGLLSLILRAGARLLDGIDVSDVVVDRASVRFADEIASGRLRLSRGSVDALPMADGTIDKAVSVNSLYFWHDLPRAMRELARIIRPGGRLVLCFEPPRTLRKWRGHKYGFEQYDVRDIVAAGKDAGFDSPEVVSEVGKVAFLCLSLTRVDANQ